MARRVMSNTAPILVAMERHHAHFRVDPHEGQPGLETQAVADHHRLAANGGGHTLEPDVDGLAPLVGRIDKPHGTAHSLH